jgi:hypothetical protein
MLVRRHLKSAFDVAFPLDGFADVEENRVAGRQCPRRCVGVTCSI